MSQNLLCVQVELYHGNSPDVWSCRPEHSGWPSWESSSGNEVADWSLVTWHGGSLTGCMGSAAAWTDDADSWTARWWLNPKTSPIGRSLHPSCYKSLLSGAWANEHDIVLSAWLGGHVIISSPSALRNFHFEKKIIVFQNENRAGAEWEEIMSLETRIIVRMRERITWTPAIAVRTCCQKTKKKKCITVIPYCYSVLRDSNDLFESIVCGFAIWKNRKTKNQQKVLPTYQLRCTEPSTACLFSTSWDIRPFQRTASSVELEVKLDRKIYLDFMKLHEIAKK